eukprot:gene856-642_t
MWPGRWGASPAARECAEVVISVIFLLYGVQKLDRPFAHAQVLDNATREGWIDAEEQLNTQLKEQHVALGHAAIRD